MEFLINLVGSDFLNSIPTIQVKNGNTDYLDLVDPKDFIDKDGNPVSLAKGVDINGREFLTFGIHLNNAGENFYEINTIFRRYSDSNKWVMCRSHCLGDYNYHFERLMEYENMSQNFINNFKNLIHNYQNENNGINLTYTDFLDRDFSFNVKIFCPSTDEGIIN